MKNTLTEKQKIFVTVGATLMVVGLAWFGIKQQSSVLTLKAPETFTEVEIAAEPIEVGNVLGEFENANQPTNPLEGIYVNPFSE